MHLDFDFSGWTLSRTQGDDKRLATRITLRRPEGYSGPILFSLVYSHISEGTSRAFVHFKPLVRGARQTLARAQELPKPIDLLRVSGIGIDDKH